MDNAMLIDERDIRLLGQIGEGAHGIVYEGKWESTNGQVSYQQLINGLYMFRNSPASSCCKGT